MEAGLIEAYRDQNGRRMDVSRIRAFRRNRRRRSSMVYKLQLEPADGCALYRKRRWISNFAPELQQRPEADRVFRRPWVWVVFEPSQEALSLWLESTIRSGGGCCLRQHCVSRKSIVAP